MFTHFYISPQHGVSTNTHCFITNGFLKKDNTTRSRSSNNITNNNIYLYDNYRNVALMVRLVGATGLKAKSIKLN